MESHHRLIAALAAGALLTGAPPAGARAPLALTTGRVDAPATWIVTARATPRAAELAERFGAQPADGGGRLLVDRSRARALATALRRDGLLRWAEPNRPLRRPPPPVLASAAALFRDRLGLGGVTLPAPAGGPVLALLDTPVELTHPAFAGGLVSAVDPLAPYDLHGTATASVAAGTGAGGVLGIWPGMRVVNWPFPEGYMTCIQSAELIDRSVAGGAATINMSYGSEEPCFAEFAALQNAARHGVLVVAAAGNSGEYGDPMEFPAAYPHILAAAALDTADVPASFSSKGPDVDLAAPGTDVMTAVPPAFDPDDTPDGWAALSGTSFASPMLAAAATVLRAMRPGLDGGQLASLLCRSARDVAPAGWDRRTGCGIPDIAAALRAPAPPPDPAEPNDDVVWLDGVGFGTETPAIWKGTGTRDVRASVTAQHDPVDVYPVRLPPRSHALVELTPLVGGADLRLLDRDALDVADRDALLASSARPGRLVDHATLVNPTRRTRRFYVAVMHDRRSANREVLYRLRLRGGPDRNDTQ